MPQADSWQSDGPSESAPEGRWVRAAAAVAGASHTDRGLPGQDYCEVRVSSSGGLVLAALSDGLGSEPHSDIGARLAVQSALRGLLAREDRLLSGAEGNVRAALEETVRAASTAVFDHASFQALPVNQFACTLIVLVAASDWMASASVGDGFVVWRAEFTDGYSLVLAPEKGENFNEVQPITSLEESDEIRFAFMGQQPAFLAASSDGLLDHGLTISSGAWHAHGPFFRFVEALARRADFAAPLLAEFLSHPQVAARGSDDKSMIVIIRNNTASSVTTC